MRLKRLGHGIKFRYLTKIDSPSGLNEKLYWFFEFLRCFLMSILHLSFPIGKGEHIWKNLHWLEFSARSIITVFKHFPIL